MEKIVTYQLDLDTYTHDCKIAHELDNGWKIKHPLCVVKNAVIVVFEKEDTRDLTHGG